MELSAIWTKHSKWLLLLRASEAIEKFSIEFPRKVSIGKAHTCSNLCRLHLAWIQEKFHDLCPLCLWQIWVYCPRAGLYRMNVLQGSSDFGENLMSMLDLTVSLTQRVAVNFSSTQAKISVKKWSSRFQPTLIKASSLKWVKRMEVIILSAITWPNPAHFCHQHLELRIHLTEFYMKWLIADVIVCLCNLIIAGTWGSEQRRYQ